MHPLRFPLVAGTLIVGFAISLARATPILITTADGLGADTFIKGGADRDNTMNSVSAAEITLKSQSTATDATARKGFLRFDLATLGAGTVTDATLSLVVSINNGGGSPAGPAQTFTVDVFGLNDGYAGVDNGAGTPAGTTDGDVLDDNDIHDEFWSESLLDFYSAPGNNPANGNGFLTAAVTLLGSFTVANTDLAGARVTMGSTPALVAFLNADTNGAATFLLRRSGTTAGGNPNLSFRSKEATPGDLTDLPELSMNVVPEPSTAALLAGGLLALHRGVRRLRA